MNDKINFFGAIILLFLTIFIILFAITFGIFVAYTTGDASTMFVIFCMFCIPQLWVKSNEMWKKANQLPK